MPSLRRFYSCLAVSGLLLAAAAGAAARRGGSPDPQFGTAGITRTPFPGLLKVTSLARQVDGKLIAGCWAWRGSSPQDTPQFTLVRYTPDGALDASFGASGVVRVEFGSAEAPVPSWCQSVKVDGQGRIVAAGGVYQAPESLTALVRCLPDGSLDETFSGDGKIVAFAGPAAQWNDVAALPGGGVLVAGSGSASGEADVTLARFDALGRPDPEFGTAGRVVTPLGLGATATGLVVRGNGIITACGQAGPYACLLQYRADGTPDPSFGTGGKVFLNAQADDDRFEQLVLQRDGKLVAAGRTSLFAGADWIDAPLLARFTAAGKVDRAFGKRGAFRGLPGGTFSDVALQSDGRIVCAGPAADLFSLFRFTRGGKPDATFGSRGVVTGIAQGASGAVLIEPSGKLVAAGSARFGASNDLLITRRLPR